MGSVREPQLSAIGAAAAAVGCFPLLAVLVYVADEYPAAHADVGALALEAGVVRLYGVVILGRWVRWVRGRLIHGGLPSRLSGPRGVGSPAGPFPFLPTPTL